MLTVSENKYFHLTNGTISYIMYLLPNQQVGHLYYGPALNVDADQLTGIDCFAQ
jgi:alpha-galactosidase